MAATPSAGPPNIFPGLRYDDAPAAIDFLKRAFGFEEHMVVEGEEGTIAHAELRLGAGMIMLGSSRSDDLGMDTPKNLGAVSVGVYIVIDDVDGHYARARAAGAEIVRELSSTDYGSKEYSARDPEGFLWHFGTYDPYASPGGV